MNRAEPKFFSADGNPPLAGREHEKFWVKLWKWIPAFAGMTIALAFSFWLMFHTFSYDGARMEMRIAYKLWSDFGAHIPLIRSFSLGSNWPIQYPIYPGEPIRYHFLFDMMVGLLEKAGIRIDWALNVPSALGFFGLIMGIFLLAKTLFRSTAVAIVSVLFFLFNGSLAFVRFFQTRSLADIFFARDFSAFAPWGPGDITAFWNLNIYTNQRHLGLAFATVLFFVITLLHIEKHSFKKQLPWALGWALLVGALPYFHQPALFIIAVTIICYFLFFPKLRVFLFAVGAVSVAIVVPQLLASRGGPPALSWYPGYIIHGDVIKLAFPNNVLRLATFWWQNLGLHTLLIPIGFFLIPRRARLVLLPILPLFIIANLFKFSVEVSANHKFFNFVMIFGQMISAHMIVFILKYVRLPLKIIVGAVLLILLTLSGVIDFFVVANDTKGSVRDIPANEVAAWIVNNTPKNAVFLNSSYLYHPASIAGRPIFLGWPYFAWSAGYPENRMPVMDTMYETRDSKERCNLLRKRNISYVTVEDVPNDVNLPKIDLAYYLKSFSPVFLTNDRRYAIFTTEELCKE